MSLQWALSRVVPEDTAAVGEKLLASDDLYRRMGDSFDHWMPEEADFVPLYSRQGRGAISPLLLGLVLVFQMLEKVPDRAAARYVVTRLDWKYALHLPLGYSGFHFTDLYAFRQRLVGRQKEALLFEQLIRRLRQEGLLRARGKMRTDATHVVALLNRLSQLELVRESLRVALRAIETQEGAWAEERIPEAFAETYSQRQNDYRLTDRQITEQLGQVGHDGYWLLKEIERGAPEGVGSLSEVETLRSVLEQQFPQGPEQGPTARRLGGRGVIETPHDPEVRGAKKGKKSWLGFKVQVTENCDDDVVSLIVDIDVTEAMDYDGTALPDIQGRLAERELTPAEQYVDQNYTSGKNLKHSAEQGIDLMGRVQEDHGAPPGYGGADFQIDEQERKAVCPQGHPSVVWSEGKGAPGTLPRVQIRFAAATCRACPAFGQCTRSAQGREVVLNPYREYIRAGRERAQTETARQAFQRRSPIEGTISELVRGHGLRYARYRGLAKMRLQALFTAVATNLKRLMRWLVRQEAQVMAATA
jgi:transposase